MSNVTNLVLLLCAAFAACIGFAAALRSCDNAHKTNFVMGRGDYRYVKLEEEQFNQLIKALESIAAQKGKMKHKIGDNVWYWYYDDNDYHVWYGTIKGLTEDGRIYVTYTSYIDIEEFEEEPFEVGFTLEPDQVFETRLEAVTDAALHHQQLIDQAVTDELEQEEEAKKAWEERTRQVFPFTIGAHVYVVIPYASGALVELKEGTVRHVPQSDNPKWFSFLPKGQEVAEMAPVAFCGLTPEEAAKLYADSRYKCLLDVFNKDPNHERRNRLCS